VFCLVTAACLHGLTSEVPPEIWMAVPAGRRAPRRADLPPLRAFRWRGPLLEVGVGEAAACGVRVAATGPARTVADLLRPRNGIPFALAAECLARYAEAGGDLAEVLAAAEALGFGDQVSPAVEACSCIRTA
jgi:hypothetical protein